VVIASELFTDGDALVRTAALVLAVVIGVWHVLGLAVCAAARTWPHRGALATLRRWSPPLARRLGGVTASVAFVLAPVSAHAQTATPPAEPPFVRGPGAQPETTASPTDSTASAPVVPSVPTEPTAPDVTPPSAIPMAATARHVVAPGDNLWRIAAAEVARRSGVAEPTDAAIVPYWRAVIAANRSTLRSGDPSLIYPGEIIALPA
jgi:hypothetical protein